MIITATGKDLDDIGLRYGLRRSGKADAEYRAHIMQYAIGIGGPPRGTIGALRAICARWHEDSPILLELFSAHTVILATTCTGPDFNSLAEDLRNEAPAGVRMEVVYDDDLGAKVNDVIADAKSHSRRGGLADGYRAGAQAERDHSWRFRARRRMRETWARWRR